jgi:hypothetical protein
MEACSTIDTSIPMPRVSREDPQEFYPAAIALVPRELPYVVENSKERPPAALNLHAGQEVYQYGWTGQEPSSGLFDLAPSILHYNWF